MILCNQVINHKGHAKFYNIYIIKIKFNFKDKVYYFDKKKDKEMWERGRKERKKILIYNPNIAQDYLHHFFQ